MATLPMKGYRRKPFPSLDDDKEGIKQYIVDEFQRLENTLTTHKQAVDVNTSENEVVKTSVTSLTATVNSNTADITSEQTARANADTALASDITSLTSTVNGVSASVTTEATTRANADTALSSDITTLEAKYGVKLNVNGYITGFQQNNDGTTGSFKILADEFKVVNPSASSGQSGTQVFGISGNQVTMQNVKVGSAVIDDLAVTNAKIGNLQVTSGKIGNSAVSTDKIANLAVTNAKISGAIQSTNYSSGSSGWKIDKNGSAEFNTATFRGALDAATGNFGDVTIASGGSLSSGQTAFDTGTGFFLGKVSGTPKFSIGTSAKSLTWDGSKLQLKGVEKIVSAGGVPFLVSAKVTYITSGSYVLLRRLYVGATGSLRVYRTFASPLGGSVTVQVRKNGSSSGLSYSTSSSTPQTGYDTYSNLEPDDYFELWGKRNSIGGQLQVSSFGFYATEGNPTISYEL